ncbi:DUF4405 domain-containing protein [Clostridium sp. D53t1_180928_C8]|uniref:DUF4405 domain-containing protein n=1 Tax=Clostridium sp. D53t1_180928_C8 TaxID=2787101 RepID=UPI0018AA18AA|nr:DUF4405 domain-containing protein [Clostridium sp. D53t1_180928_C8]
MKNKNVLKLLLSLSLGLIFILMMNVKTTGLLFHEIFGIIILAGIIIHNIFNWNWTKGISKTLFKNKLTFKAKIMYILVILLCLSLSVITLTGILMSKYILTSITAKNILTIKFLHKYSSYFAVGAVSIHFLLHTKYIFTSLKKLILNITEKNVRIAISQFSIIIILIVILYFPITTYLNNNTTFYEDNDIVFEEIIEEIPSENIELVDNTISNTDNVSDSNLVENDTNETEENINKTTNNNLSNTENIDNSNSSNSTINENQNTPQSNTTVQTPSQNNNSNNNNNNSNNTQNKPIETPSVTPPPVVNPPIEEDKKEDDTTIDNSANLEAELMAYLKRLGCNGCERGCMLDNPFCMIGIEKAAKAKDKFLQFHTYNVSNDKFII